METIIDGYWQDHPVIIVNRWRDSGRPGIEWVRVRTVDGTAPFLRHGFYSSHYEDCATVRLDKFILINRKDG